MSRRKTRQDAKTRQSSKNLVPAPVKHEFHVFSCELLSLFVS
jgi:hypothetical protein